MLSLVVGAIRRRINHSFPASVLLRKAGVSVLWCCAVDAEGSLYQGGHYLRAPGTLSRA